MKRGLSFRAGSPGLVSRRIQDLAQCIWQHQLLADAGLPVEVAKRDASLFCTAGNDFLYCINESMDVARRGRWELKLVFIWQPPP